MLWRCRRQCYSGVGGSVMGCRGQCYNCVGGSVIAV